MRRRSPWPAAAVVTVAAISLFGPSSSPGGSAAEAADSRSRVALVELGRRLFFDPAISLMGSRACADCHHPEHGYSDPAPKSLDVVGVTPHHTQTLIDVADAKSFHWHGEKRSIRELVRDRAASSAYDIGFGTSDEDEPPDVEPQSFLLTGQPFKPADAFVSSQPFGRGDSGSVIREAARYREAFTAAFGVAVASSERVEEAVEAYCLTLRSGSSPFDRFAAGDSSALSPSAQRGLELFRGKAGCSSCHTMSGERPTFTDQALHDLHGEQVLAARSLSLRKPGPVTSFSSGAPRQVVEDAAKAAEAAEEASHRWKTPTLRDVALRGPYFHTGLATTLEQAVRFFRPPDATPGVVPADKPWTDEQVADVVAFLRSVTSDRRPGLVEATWSERSSQQRLRFVDDHGDSLRRFDVVLVPAGDALPLCGEASELRLKTGDDGTVRYDTPLHTQLRVVLEGGLEPVGGPLVPDSCRSAKIQVPIRGRARVEVTLPADMAAPETLVATHTTATRFPDRKLPTTTLKRESVRDGPKGTTLATYSAPMRTDVPPAATVDVPGRTGPFIVTFLRDQVVPLYVHR